MVFRPLISIILRIAVGALAALLLIIGIAYLAFGRGGEAEEIKWGACFDPYYAEYLGLDWQETYLSLLDDIGVDNFRLVAFWDAVEPVDDQFDFGWLDFQIQEAEKRGARLILAVGKRLPRWPECHVPAWAADLSDEEELTEVLEFLTTVVNRYKESSALEYWQVENEPYVWFFGECGRANIDHVKREMGLVEELDPSHPILLTESGELSTWVNVSRLGDHIGISIYEIIYARLGLASLFPGYRRYPLPQEYYRIKANFLRWSGLIEEIFVSELQAEPWGPEPLIDMPLSEQYRSFNPDLFRHNLDFARSTGFSRFYLWGAEWWFYARETHGVSDFIEIAKELWR
jgi:hypothetical protein